MDVQLFWISIHISASHISQLPTDMQTFPQETSLSQFIFLRSIFRLLHKIAKSDYYLCHVCSHIHMEQLGSHWMDFHEIWYLSIFRTMLLRMRNVSDKHCTENENTHFMFKTFFFLNCAIVEIMWKNMIEPDRLQMTIWHMHNACRITKATNTHLE